MIAIVLDEPPPRSTEGGSSRLNGIIRHICRVAPGSRVYAAGRGPSSRALYLAWGLLRGFSLALQVLASRQALVLLSCPALPFFRSASRIDLLLTTCFLAFLRVGCRLSGKLLLLNLHDLRSLQIPAFGQDVGQEALELFQRVEQRALNASDFVLSPTGDWPDTLVERYGVPRERLIEFPNGNERIEDLPPSPIPDSSALKLVYAGTMGMQGRAVDEFVERFVEIESPEVRLYLLGPGGPEEPEGSWADPRVVYLGTRPLPECIAAVRSCDLAVYPYPDAPYFNATHATNKMALYVTCAVPLLARRSRHVTRFVEGEAVGVACEIDELPSVVRRVLEDRSQLDTWRRNLQRISNDYYWDSIIDRALSEALERSGSKLRWPAEARAS